MTTKCLTRRSYSIIIAAPLGRDHGSFQVCAREPSDGLQRVPLRDDKEFDAIAEMAGEDWGANETREFPQRRKSLSAKVLHIVLRLVWPSHATASKSR